MKLKKELSAITMDEFLEQDFEDNDESGDNDISEKEMRELITQTAQYF